MPDPIPLDQIHKMSEREISLLVITHLNGLTTQIDTFVRVLESKVTRDEYKSHVEESKEIIKRYDTDFEALTRRVGTVENIIDNYGIRGKTIFSVGKYFWIIVLGLMNLVQFFYTIGSNQ